MWRCPSCGVTNSDDLVCNYCHTQAPTGATTDSPIWNWTLRQWYWFLRWLVCGAVTVGVGVWIMLYPGLGQTTNEFSVEIFGAGLVVFVAGLAMLGASYLAIRRQKKN